MNAGHAISSHNLRMADDANISTWVGALAARECTEAQFMEEILRREQEDKDMGWEALAALDQYFRRQKIDRDLFMNMKDSLHRHLLPASPLQPAAPMVATREAGVTDIPVITTTPEPLPAAEPDAAAVHDDLRVGDRLLGRYHVVEILRRNVMGTLVEAIDEQKIDVPCLRKRVAIQMVAGTIARQPEFLVRISKLQSLSHPSIARLIDVQESGGSLLLVMELLNGPSLQELLFRTEGGELQVTLAHAALKAVASAMMYAHSQGVTHGNISAANVCITQAAEFRLQGFELQHPTSLASFASDQHDFARLAYEMLAGPNTLGTQLDGTLRLRQPRGLQPDQWRALRDALKRSNRDHSDVFTAFAGRKPGVSHRGWGVAAAMAAVLGVGGYYYLTATPFAEPQEAPAAAASSLATPPPPLEVQQEAAEPAAPVAAAAPVVVRKSRIELATQTASVDTFAPVAKIRVRRSGNLDGTVTFKWWTESGTALVDREFRRVEPRIEYIPAGSKGIELLVPLIPDPARQEARTFWVKIDEPGEGATLGNHTLMQVSIDP